MRRTHLWLGALSLACVAGAARAQVYSNHSTTLTAGTVTQVLPAPSPNFPRTDERKINVGVSTGGFAWCSREDPNPAPNKAGSWALGPAGNPLGLGFVEEFHNGTHVPTPLQPLWCTADVGSVPLTVETLP